MRSRAESTGVCVKLKSQSSARGLAMKDSLAKAGVVHKMDSLFACFAYSPVFLLSLLQPGSFNFIFSTLFEHISLPLSVSVSLCSVLQLVTVLSPVPLSVSVCLSHCAPLSLPFSLSLCLLLSLSALLCLSISVCLCLPPTAPPPSRYHSVSLTTS